MDWGSPCTSEEPESEEDKDQECSQGADDAGVSSPCVHTCQEVMLETPDHPAEASASEETFEQTFKKSKKIAVGSRPPAVAGPREVEGPRAVEGPPAVEQPPAVPSAADGGDASGVNVAVTSVTSRKRWPKGDDPRRCWAARYPPHGVPALRKFLDRRQQAFIKKGKEPPPLVILAGKKGPEGDLIWTADATRLMLEKEDAERERALQKCEA